VPAEESLLPEPHHEAEAIIKGIQAIAAARWHDRAYELVDATGQKVITAEGPSEIASWVFPHETQEEDEKRAALRTDIEALLDAIRERA